MVINRKQDAIDGVTWKCNNKVSKRKQKQIAEHEFRFVTEHGLRILNLQYPESSSTIFFGIPSAFKFLG